jgi:iron complex transport system substrate-binding protein
MGIYLRARLTLAGLVAGLALAACAGGGSGAGTPLSEAQRPAPAQAPIATPNPLAGVAGIVDPANRGWPRQVDVLNGRVTITKKPLRIVTVSLGHDEITLSLVPRERVVAAGAATKDRLYSNIVELVRDMPTVTRDPERIISFQPDIVVTAFYQTELTQALAKLGIPIVQTGLQNDPAGRIDDIRLLGYIYGEEERAEGMAQQAQRRLGRVTAFVQKVPRSQRPRVLSLNSYGDRLYTAGGNSTEGGIILAAGGRNAAEEAGLEGNPTISLESISAMAPDLIVVPQTRESAEPFIQRLLNEPALAEVPAVKGRRVFHGESSFFTTLSFWNIRGVEELAKLLWPEEFGRVEFPAFEYPG